MTSLLRWKGLWGALLLTLWGCQDPKPTPTVGLPDVTIELTPLAVTMNPGQEQSFAVRVSGTQDTRVAFSLLDTAEGASISTAGTFLAPAKEGLYRIRVTSVANPSESAEAQINVTTYPQVSVVAFPQSTTMGVGESRLFVAKVQGATASVQWSVWAGPSGGSIDAQGAYTAPSQTGTFHLLATSTEDTSKVGVAKVTVVANPTSKIAIVPSQAEVRSGTSQAFVAKKNDDTAANVSWSIVEAPQGGKIDTNGLYTAVEAGTFRIMAQSQEDTSQIAFATVRVPGPQPPQLTGSNPPSPSNIDSPLIQGEAQPNSQVELFLSNICRGTALAKTDVSAEGTFSQRVILPENTTTYIYGRVLDANGNVSICSTTFVAYQEDSVAPTKPEWTGTTPASPTNATTTVVASGTAEPNITVEWFATADCTGAIGANVSVTPEGIFSRTFSVPANTTSTWSLRAKDAAGNVSACSAPLSFTHDNVAPPSPVLSPTSPTSPSQSNNLTVTGTAEAQALITVYGQNSCAGNPLGTATANASGQFTLNLSVPANSTTELTAKAQDAVGNVSPCTDTALVYISDNSPPSAPVLSGTLPISPSSTSVSPQVVGTGEPSSIVRVYKNDTCAGSSAISTLVQANGSFSTSLSVTANSSTSLSARLTDAAGNVSSCSNVLVYVHDSVAPSRPVVTGTSPQSPSNSNTPSVAGTAEGGSLVEVFSNASCTGSSLGQATATAQGNFDVSVTVQENTTTTLYARAIDAAGNLSACSSTSVSYVEDSIPFAAPVLSQTVPASGANNNQPKVLGTAPGGTDVRLHTNENCSGSPIDTKKANFATGAFEFTVTVADNSTTKFSASTIDAAGNTACSTAFLTYTEISASLSGTIAYNGSQTGRIFIVAYNTSGQAVSGTSLAANGPFSLRNLPETGSYTVRAWMDVLGVYRYVSAVDPESAATVNVTGNVTGVNLTLQDPAAAGAPPTPVLLNVYAGPNVFAVQLQRIVDAEGFDAVEDYEVVLHLTPSVSSADLTRTFHAGQGEWVFMDGLVTGTDYYLSARAKIGSNWSPFSTPAGPFNSGAPVGARSITGSVNFTGVSPTGSLYVLALNEVAGAFVSIIDSPSSPQSFTLPGVAIGRYTVYAFFDNNVNGLWDVDEPGTAGTPSLAFVPGSATTLIINNSRTRSRVEIAATQTVGGSVSYAANVRVIPNGDQPVAAVLQTSGGVVGPIDLALTESGAWGPPTLEANLPLGASAPSLGNTYQFLVTQRNGTTAPYSATVTGLVQPPTPLAPVASSSSKPTFSWSAPTSTQSLDHYRVRVEDIAGTVWWQYRLPSSSSSLTYDVDGRATTDPIPSGTSFRWSIEAIDIDGNRGLCSVTTNSL